MESADVGLRRAIPVRDSTGRRQVIPEDAQRSHWYLLTGEDDLAQGAALQERKRLRAAGAQQSRRYGVPNGNTSLDNEAAEAGDAAERPVGYERQPGGGHGRPEEVEDAQIERRRRMLRDDIVLPQSHCIGRPPDERQCTGVRVSHPLGPTCGARRVQDVRERRGRYLDRRPQPAELVHLAQALAHWLSFRGSVRIEPAPAEPVQRRRVVTRAVMSRIRVAEDHRPQCTQSGDHGDRLGVGGDDVRPRWWGQVIDRHIGAACQQRAEDGDRKRDVLG